MTYDRIKGAVLTPTAIQQLEELQDGNNSSISDHLVALNELFEFVFNSPNELNPDPKQILEMMQDIRELMMVLRNLEAPKK